MLKILKSDQETNYIQNQVLYLQGLKFIVA